jgi:hypothetical protein
MNGPIHKQDGSVPPIFVHSRASISAHPAKGFKVPGTAVANGPWRPWPARAPSGRNRRATLKASPRHLYRSL